MCFMHMQYNFSSAIIKLVLSCLITRYIPLPVVFRQMEYIMTLTLEESEEISEEVLSSLLTSVRKKNEVWGLYCSCVFVPYILPVLLYIILYNTCVLECFVPFLEIGGESFEELCSQTQALSPKSGQIQEPEL